MPHKKYGVSADIFRRRIQVGKLIARLQKCALGREKMNTSEIRAAEALLRKIVPDLVQAQMQAEVEHRVIYCIEAPKQLEPDVWERKYGRITGVDDAKTKGVQLDQEAKDPAGNGRELPTWRTLTETTRTSG